MQRFTRFVPRNKRKTQISKIITLAKNMWLVIVLLLDSHTTSHEVTEASYRACRESIQHNMCDRNSRVSLSFIRVQYAFSQSNR